MDYFQAEHVESLHAGSSELCRLYRGKCFYMFVSDPCLANSAKLKAFSLEIQALPPLLGDTFCPNLTKPFFFSFACPHQNLSTMDVISSQRAFGKLKTLIVYIGTTWATVLMSISFLACESSFSFQSESLLFSPSVSCWNVLLLFFPTKDGRPKYFSCC